MNIDKILSLKSVIILSIILLVCRIIFSLFFVDCYHSFEDHDIAQNLIAGNGYTYFSSLEPTAVKSPVYPLFLSFIIWIFGASNKIAIVIMQHILISSVPLLIVKTGQQLKIEKLGIIGGIIFCLHPSYFYYPNIIEVTNLFIPLFALWLYWFIKILNLSTDKLYFKDIRTTRVTPIYFGFAVLSGILILTHPVVIPVLLAGFIIIASKRNLRLGLLIVLICCSLQVPWIVRNYNAFGKIIPTKSPFWMNLYAGYLPVTHSTDKFDIIPDNEKAKIDSLRKIKNDVDMEPYFKEVVKKAISRHPLLFLHKTIYQIYYYWWVPPGYRDNDSLNFFFVRKGPIILLTVLSIPGIFIAYKKIKIPTIFGLAVLFYYSLIYGLTSSENIRYKLDIEWIECFFAAFTVYFLFRKCFPGGDKTPDWN